MKKGNLLCTFHDAAAFRTFINGLRAAADTKNNKNSGKDYILVESTDVARIEGYSCDGYRLHKQVCCKVAVEAPFQAYLRIPPVFPRDAKSKVTLERGKDSVIITRFESICLLSVQPEEPIDFHKLYQSVQVEPGIRIGMNRNFIQEAAMSLFDGPNDFKAGPVILEVTDSPVEPIKLSRNGNERYLLPVRLRKE